MPKTIPDGFEQLLGWIRATPTETEAAKAHRASIEAKLKSSFGNTSFFRTGSFGNGTSVSGHSGIDFFAVMPPRNLKANSLQLQADLAAALRERFPNTGVKIDGPAIKVPFGPNGSESTEVVPVEETGLTTLKHRQFLMPDGRGGWKFSAPDSHNAWVSEIDKSKNRKVKPLIRFVKAWKFYNDLPISSFFLEIRTAEYANGETAFIYDIDVARMLTILADEGLSPRQDPRFSGQVLTPCASEDKRQQSLLRLRGHASIASQAVTYRQNGEVRKAFELWRAVYRNRFPAFGY